MSKPVVMLLLLIGFVTGCGDLVGPLPEPEHERVAYCEVHNRSLVPQDIRARRTSGIYPRIVCYRERVRVDDE